MSSAVWLSLFLLAVLIFGAFCQQTQVWGISKTTQDILYKNGVAGNANVINTAAEASTTWLSVGKNTVWRIDGTASSYGGNIFFREGLSDATPTGTSWTQIDGQVIKLAVSCDGLNMWGVNGVFNVFRRTGITYSSKKGSGWAGIDGTMTSVVIGDTGVWAIDTQGKAFFREGVSASNPSGSGWTLIAGTIVFKAITVSCDGLRVWGMDISGFIYYRTGVTSTSPKGTDWVKVDAGFSTLAVSQTGLIGARADGTTVYRTGITSTNPQGTGWSTTDGKFAQLSAFDDSVVAPESQFQQIWGRTATQDVLFKNGLNGAVKQINTAAEASTTWFSVGRGTVWRIDGTVSSAGGNIFFREGITPSTPSGTSWTQIDGQLKQLSVSCNGLSLWGVSATGSTYRRNGITSTSKKGTGWLTVDGVMSTVALTDNGVLAIDMQGKVYYRDGVTTAAPSGTVWTNLASSLFFNSISASCDGLKIWAVDSLGDLYFRTGVSSVPPKGLDWVKVDSGFASISVSQNGVFGIKTDGSTVYRTGISTSNFIGTGWTTTDGQFKQISVANDYSVAPENSPTTPVSNNVTLGYSSPGYSVSNIVGNSVSNSPLSQQIWGASKTQDVYFKNGYSGSVSLINTAAQGSASWISVGRGIVWRLDGAQTAYGGNIYVRDGITESTPTGTTWTYVDCCAAVVSVSCDGLSAWFINSAQTIFRRTGITTSLRKGTGWQVIDGLLVSLAVTDTGLWGVNNEGKIFYRDGMTPSSPTGTGWAYLASTPIFKTITASCDGLKVWAIDSLGDLYFRTGVTSSAVKGSGWAKVDSGFTGIAASLTTLIGVKTDGTVVYRNGISSSNFQGTYWTVTTEQFNNRISIYDDGTTLSVPFSIREESSLVKVAFNGKLSGIYATHQAACKEKSMALPKYSELCIGQKYSRFNRTDLNNLVKTSLTSDIWIPIEGGDWIQAGQNNNLCLKASEIYGSVPSWSTDVTKQSSASNYLGICKMVQNPCNINNGGCPLVGSYCSNVAEYVSVCKCNPGLVGDGKNCKYELEDLLPSVDSTSCFNAFTFGRKYFYKSSMLVKLQQSAAISPNRTEMIVKEKYFYTLRTSVQPVATSSDNKNIYLMLTIHDADLTTIFPDPDVQAKWDKGNSKPEFLKNLQNPFYFRQTCDQLVTNVYFPTSEKSSVVDMKRGIAASFSNFLNGDKYNPKNDETIKYTNYDEMTPNGAATMAYTLDSTPNSDGCTVLTKQLANADTLSNEPKIQEGESTHVCFNANGNTMTPNTITTTKTLGLFHTDTLSSDQKSNEMFVTVDLKTDLHSTAQVLSSHLTQTIHETDNDFLQTLSDSHDTQFVGNTLGNKEYSFGIRIAADNELLDSTFSSAKMETIFAELESDSADKNAHKELTELIAGSSRAREFISNFITTPEFLRIKSQLFRTNIYNAICHSGFSDSASLLETIISLLQSDEEKERVVAAAAFLPLPSQKLIVTFKKFALESKNALLQMQSMFTLGAMVHNLKVSGKEDQAKELLQFLTDLFDEAVNADKVTDIETIIGAFQNARDDSAISIIHDHLSHASPSIRGAAAAAMRTIDISVSSEKKLVSLLADHDNFVRYMAITALKSRPVLSESSIDEITRAFVFNDNQQVKAEILQYLQDKALQGSNAAHAAFALLHNQNLMNLDLKNQSVLFNQGHVCDGLISEQICNGNGEVISILNGHSCYCQCKTSYTGLQCEKRDCSKLSGWDKLDCRQNTARTKFDSIHERVDDEEASTLVANVLQTTTTKWFSCVGSSACSQTKDLGVPSWPFSWTLPSYQEAISSNPKWRFSKTWGTSDIYAGVEATYDSKHSWDANAGVLQTFFIAGGSIYGNLWTLRVPVIETYAKFDGSFDYSLCTQTNNFQMGFYNFFQGTKQASAISTSSQFCRPSDRVCVPQLIGEPQSVRLGAVTLKKYSYSFIVAIIPITMKVSLNGELSVDYDVFVGTETTSTAVSALLTGYIKPNGRLYASASLAVDIILVEAGIDCSLTLLDAKLPITVGLGLADFKFCMNAGLELGTLGGSIMAYVKLNLLVYRERFDKTIFSWSERSTSLTLPTPLPSRCCEDCPVSCDAGVCDRTTLQCTCFNGFYGSNCGAQCPGKTYSHSDSSWICNGRGNTTQGTKGCVFDGTNTRCICKNGYWGAACENVCPGADTPAGPCSGRGSCIEDGKCICDSGYFGYVCNITCPDTAKGKCSSAGKCSYDSTKNTPFCLCDFGNMGDNCEYKCPVENGKICSDNGKCSVDSQTNTAKCVCKNGFGGETCADMNGAALYALRLDADGNELTVPTDVTVKKSYTIEFWFSNTYSMKTTDLTTFYKPLFKLAGTTYSINSQGKFTTSGTAVCTSIGTAPFYYSQNNYIAISGNIVAGTVSVFVNGAQTLSCTNVLKNTGLIDVAIPFTLTGTSNVFDELRFFNYEITVNDMAERNARMKISLTTYTPGLVTYFTFDEGYGLYAYSEKRGKLPASYPAYKTFISSRAPIYLDGAPTSPQTFAPAVDLIIEQKNPKVGGAYLFLRTARNSVTEQLASDQIKKVEIEKNALTLLATQKAALEAQLAQTVSYKPDASALSSVPSLLDAEIAKITQDRDNRIQYLSCSPDLVDGAGQSASFQRTISAAARQNNRNSISTTYPFALKPDLTVVESCSSTTTTYNSFISTYPSRDISIAPSIYVTNEDWTNVGAGLLDVFNYWMNLGVEQTYTSAVPVYQSAYKIQQCILPVKTQFKPTFCNETEKAKVQQVYGNLLEVLQFAKVQFGNAKETALDMYASMYPYVLQIVDNIVNSRNMERKTVASNYFNADNSLLDQIVLLSQSMSNLKSACSPALTATPRDSLYYALCSLTNGFSIDFTDAANNRKIQNLADLARYQTMTTYDINQLRSNTAALDSQLSISMDNFRKYTVSSSSFTDTTDTVTKRLAKAAQDMGIIDEVFRKDTIYFGNCSLVSVNQWVPLLTDTDLYLVYKIPKEQLTCFVVKDCPRKDASCAAYFQNLQLFTPYSPILSFKDLEVTFELDYISLDSFVSYIGYNYITITPTASMLSSLSNSFTAEAWIKQSAFKDTDESFVFRVVDDATSPPRGIVITSNKRITVNTDLYGTKKVLQATTTTASYTFLNSLWYHVAFVFDGFALKILVNGEEVSVVGIGRNKIDFDYTRSSQIWIGGSSDTSRISLDDFKLWKTQRTKEQIRRDMFSSVTDYDDSELSNLMLYYDFTEQVPNQPTVVKDVSPSKLNGVGSVSYTSTKSFTNEWQNCPGVTDIANNICGSTVSTTGGKCLFDTINNKYKCVCDAGVVVQECKTCSEVGGTLSNGWCYKTFTITEGSWSWARATCKQWDSSANLLGPQTDAEMNLSYIYCNPYYNTLCPIGLYIDEFQNWRVSGAPKTKTVSVASMGWMFANTGYSSATPANNVLGIVKPMFDRYQVVNPDTWYTGGLQFVCRKP